jgi:hypothetical protein
MRVRSRIAFALFLLAVPGLLLAQQGWVVDPTGTEVSTDERVRIFANALPQFTLDATNEARIQLKIGGADKFLVLHDGTSGLVGTQTGGGDLRLFSNGNARTIISALGNFTTSTVNNGYMLSGETLGARLFSLDGRSGGFGRAALVAANGGTMPYTVKNDPLGRQYGLAGIVGSAAEMSGGGSHTVGVYGYTLFNVGGTNTHSLNIQSAGLFISELGSNVTDFRAPQYGVYGRADARSATGTVAASQTGIVGEAFGRAVDTAVGAYVTASGGAVNRGLQVSGIAAAANNYSIYSDAPAKSYFAGNVGIGVTAPSANLHVAGDVVVDGNIAAKYQDVAEWVAASDDLAPGTVVVLDPNLPNHVTASTRPYDTAVAGVVSAQPGIILGERGQSKEQIATTGRVRVRVDATSSPIRIGDLLVSSHRPGTAMKSQPLDLGGVDIHRPGTVIGKALEPLDDGVGDILVLLSLQ